MGNLIDDLLSFSRLSRQEMRLTKIDMHSMAKAVYEELALPEDAKPIEFHLANLPDAFGDPAMVQEVRKNLIGNAIEFTSNKPNRIVEIGYRFEKNENIYYVKDNGAGFDRAYAHQLFGVFQRLQSTKEFEGTGVGRANVQRIVHRLKGRVWAERIVNEGGTFYFTLPNIRSAS
jgi:two-component system sensor kinase